MKNKTHSEIRKKNKTQHQKGEDREYDDISNRFCHVMNPSVSKKPEKKENNGEEKEKLGDDQFRFCFGYIFFRSIGFLLLGHKRMISFLILVLLRRIYQDLVLY